MRDTYGHRVIQFTIPTPKDLKNDAERLVRISKNLFFKKLYTHLETCNGIRAKVSLRVYYLLTKSCWHAPIYGNKRRWLWEYEQKRIDDDWWNISRCTICGDIEKTMNSTNPLWLVPDYIKEGAAEHWGDTLQPRRQGEPSREFIQKYPDQAKQLFTPQEMKKAKNVWYDERGAQSSKG